MNTPNESKRPSAEPCNLFAPDDIVRHVRSGHTCRVLGRCTIEATLADCYMYRCTDGHVWIRPVLEMEDGRFVLLTRELDAAQPALDSDAFTPPPEGFTCFHCGSHFASTPKGINAAREHFGETPNAPANCVIVPRNLPFEVLGEAAQAGVFETGNPKHGWDYLLAKVGRPVAQPAQAGEAVAWQWCLLSDPENWNHLAPWLVEEFRKRADVAMRPLYLHPQPEQPASEECVPYESDTLPEGMQICGLPDGTIDVYTNDETGKKLLNINPMKRTAGYAEKLAQRNEQPASAVCGTCDNTGLANVVDPDDGALVIDDCPECGGESAEQSPAVSPPSVVAVTPEVVPAPKVAVSDEDVLIANEAFTSIVCNAPMGADPMRAALESFAQRMGSGEKSNG